MIDYTADEILYRKTEAIRTEKIEEGREWRRRNRGEKKGDIPVRSSTSSGRESGEEKR